MGIFVIRATDTIGDAYAPVAVEADDIVVAMRRYEELWYPGIFTDIIFVLHPSVNVIVNNIGEVEINCVDSFIRKAETSGE
jgi:hypothetical protein